MSCKTKIRLFAYVQMVVLLLFLSSTSLFVHSHVIDGEHVVHSHLYAGPASTHTHTSIQLNVLSRSYSPEVCAVEFVVPGVAEIDTFTTYGDSDVEGYDVIFLRHFSLRAPPAMA